MKMTCTRPLTLKTKNGPKAFNPGETFEVDLEKAKPYIEQGLLRLVGDSQEDHLSDPVEILDAFFSQVIMPRLTRLHTAGRLPDLSRCPLWNRIDEAWQVPASDVEAVKAAMNAALEAYEGKTWK